MRKTLAFMLSLFVLAYVGLVYADDGGNVEGQNTDREQQREEKRTEREQWKTERQTALEQLKQQKEAFRATFKEKLAADRCARIETRIQKQAAKLGSAEVKHMSAYTNLQNRIQKFIDRFDAFNATNGNKLDAVKLAQLKTDQATLITMISTFQSTYADYFTKFNATKTSACGTTEGNFRASLADARVYLQTVHDSAAAIRTFVRETILPDLLAVKKDIAKARGGAEESSDEATENENESENENETTETADTVPPTVSITSPADGTPYIVAATVNIEASAADNVKVEKVKFYDGSSLKDTDEEAPYSYSWSITDTDNGTHIWTAVAYDDEDNSATSGPVSVTVAIPTATPTP